MHVEGPLYAQLERALRERIEAGEFKPGESLPTEEALGRTYGVSRITVRRALENLCSELLLERRHGVGTFVRGPQTAQQSVRLRGFLDDVLALDRHLRFSLVRQDRLTPPLEVAQAFGPKVDAPVLLAVSIARLDDSPFMVGECYFASERISVLRATDFAGREQPTLRVLTRNGIALKRGEQSIAAVLAERPVAAALEITAGAPVLQVIRTYIAVDEFPVAVIRGWYHPVNYRLSVDLQPRRGPARRALARR